MNVWTTKNREREREREVKKLQGGELDFYVTITSETCRIKLQQQKLQSTKIGITQVEIWSLKR